MSGKVGIILMDLSKAYDSILQELLITKLEAYRIKRNSLKPGYSYVANRTQRVLICSSCIPKHMSIGVAQRSVFGPLLSISV